MWRWFLKPICLINKVYKEGRKKEKRKKKGGREEGRGKREEGREGMRKGGKRQGRKGGDRACARSPRAIRGTWEWSDFFVSHAGVYLHPGAHHLFL